MAACSGSGNSPDPLVTRRELIASRACWARAAPRWARPRVPSPAWHLVMNFLECHRELDLTPQPASVRRFHGTRWQELPGLRGLRPHSCLSWQAPALCFHGGAPDRPGRGACSRTVPANTLSLDLTWQEHTGCLPLVTELQGASQTPRHQNPTCTMHPAGALGTGGWTSFQPRGRARP